VSNTTETSRRVSLLAIFVTIQTIRCTHRRNESTVEDCPHLDVHLHDGEDGQPIRNAFAHVIDAVLETQADLFLIAGDLFDHTRVKGDVIDFVYQQLSRVSCPTVIIAGNHDCWRSVPYCSV